MNKARIIIRVTSVIALILFYGFIFSVSKSTGGIGSSNAKLISHDGNVLVMEMPFTEREIEVSNVDEFQLVVGQWYKVSHKHVTWGYYPLLVEVESTYTIEAYYDFENEIETETIPTSKIEGIVYAYDSNSRKLGVELEDGQIAWLSIPEDITISISSIWLAKSGYVIELSYAGRLTTSSYNQLSGGTVIEIILLQEIEIPVN